MEEDGVGKAELAVVVSVNRVGRPVNTGLEVGVFRRLAVAAPPHRVFYNKIISITGFSPMRPF